MPVPMCSIAVVIPCYKVKKHILQVLSVIPSEVAKVYVVDDCCPEKSGDFVRENSRDARITVLYNQSNQGVGGAVMAGYKQALQDNMDVIVKIDGDGQMDPALLPQFVAPILNGEADYCKGNRFYELESLEQMPKMRLFGNAILSFMTKISSGYWHVFDPTNGYTAIHKIALGRLRLDKIHKRYFFETDLLFRLNTIRAVVMDIPMTAKYDDETSNLKISKILGTFLLGHFKNTGKRIFYNYYLRDVSIASLFLPFGLFFTIWGVGFGLYKWIAASMAATAATTGTVMLSALAIILGVQLLLTFIHYDISSVPRKSLQSYISVNVKI